MTKVKMTIHRGLSELKTLDDRIEKSINGINSSGIKQKDKKVNNVYDEATFISDAKSNLQSTVDLIKRKTAIKASIVQSNSITNVKIGEVEMTVADAITEKENVQLRKKLLDTLDKKHTKAVADLNLNNEKINQNADVIVNAAVNGDQTKTNGAEAVSVRKTYIDANEFSLIDPLGVEKYVKEEREKIAVFEMEVDAVLSESNAVTMIEV